MVKKKLQRSSLMLMIILLLPLVFALPIGNYLLYDKFTYSIEKAQRYSLDKSFEVLEGKCEFGAVSIGRRPAECQPAPCKTFNIDGKDCVREGMTGGFFNSRVYYVCKDYGRMALHCVDYFDNQEELNEYWRDKTEK